MIKSKPRTPILFSDFDGTAVETVGKLNPRNLTKYPLRPIDGWYDFMCGALYCGVDLGGVVSRRPNIWPRRFVTDKTMSEIGGYIIFEPSQVVLAGSESAKAGVLVRHADARLVGMIDDKPHRIGIEILKCGAVEKGAPASANPAHVVLGVVDTAKADQYIERTLVKSDKLGYEVQEGVVVGDAEIAVITNEQTRLDVVQLRPYSYESGIGFAALLSARAA